MARPVKKAPEQWKKEIMEAAKKLFLTRGYEETAITDIMELAGEGNVLPFFPEQGGGYARFGGSDVYGK